MFCDDCTPWFADDNIDHAAEQERARTVAPLKAAPLTATNIIDDWQRQG